MPRSRRILISLPDDVAAWVTHIPRGQRSHIIACALQLWRLQNVPDDIAAAATAHGLQVTRDERPGDWWRIDGLTNGPVFIQTTDELRAWAEQL